MNKLINLRLMYYEDAHKICNIPNKMYLHSNETNENGNRT